MNVGHYILLDLKDYGAQDNMTLMVYFLIIELYNMVEVELHPTQSLDTT